MTLRRIALAAALAAAPGAAGAHGGYTIENDPCVARIDGRPVHFSAYQPDRNPTEEYCDEIPEVGSAILVLDLVDRELRARPLAFRVERPDGSILLEVAEKTYPAGVVNAEAQFESAGSYRAVVAPSGGAEATFPLEVATGFSPLLLSIPLVLAAAPVLYWAARRGGTRRPPPPLTPV